MLIFKYMCIASDSRTIVVAMLLFVENEYEICITVRSLGVSGGTRNYLVNRKPHPYARYICGYAAPLSHTFSSMWVYKIAERYTVAVDFPKSNRSR